MMLLISNAYVAPETRVHFSYYDSCTSNSTPREFHIRGRGAHVISQDIPWCQAWENFLSADNRCLRRCHGPNAGAGVGRGVGDQDFKVPGSQPTLVPQSHTSSVLGKATIVTSPFEEVEEQSESWSIISPLAFPMSLLPTEGVKWHVVLTQDH